MDLTKAVALIKEFEGCKLTSYRCPAGVWTIGYGTTGDDIIEGLTWTQEQCEERLLRDVTYFSNGVKRLLAANFTENQFNALVSFAYNVGLQALKNSSLLIFFNSGRLGLASNEFMRWNKAKGRELPGLTKRRDAERILFLTT